MSAKSLVSAIWVFLFVMLLANTASAETNVTLILPVNGNISVSKNMTFFCNATSDKNVYSISLHNDINGAFGPYDTKEVMGLERDSNTTLLCHFDSNYTCEDGEVGTNTTTDFASSKFMWGVWINEPDTLTYPVLNNIDYSRGTIEFWIKLGFAPAISDDVWLFSTGNAVSNEMQFYISSDGVYFEFYDNIGGSANVYKGFSGWDAGQWHHVAVVWDIDGLFGSEDQSDIFLDANNASVTHANDFSDPDTYTFSNDLMYIGSDADGGQQNDLIFDEFRISNRPRTPGEINASYTKELNHSNETANWTINNIQDGSYKWNCMVYDNDSQSFWASANYTFHVDSSTPPSVSAIIISPNETDDLDPGITINVTANVTDVSNVSFVVFQWKETGEWNNDTMDYNNLTGLYENASITTDQTGGVYYYRIWSNDTLGHSGNSTTYNLTAAWDYTWTRDPSDFGTAYGFIGCPDCYVGTLVINNTGDDILSFLLTNDWPLGISYNVSNPLDVNPKNATHINVTAQFSGNESEYNVNINITASHGSETPSPILQTVAATLNSYSGGPYFDNDDLTLIYPTSVYQGMSYNLSAKLKNIGNESTTDVWINWSLPAGWINTSGNLTQYIGVLNGTADGGNIAWNNITVYITPGSAAAGVHNIYVNATSSDSLTANSSIVTYVSCNNDDGVCGSGCSYVTDDDCSLPGGGTTGGSTLTAISGVAREYKIGLVVPPRLDVNRGESQAIRIGVTNNISGTKLTGVHMSLSGYLQTFVSSSPSRIDEIAQKETKYFDVEIRAPVYAVYGEYYLNVTVKGEFVEGSDRKSAESSARLLLVTHKFIENETIGYLEKAEAALKDMVEAGFETKQVNGLVEEIKKAMDEGNYDRVKELSDEAIELRETAFKMSEQIKETEENIAEMKGQSISLPESERMLFLAKAAFQRGDYKMAEGRISGAMLVYAVETGNSGILIFINKYWWLVTAAFIICISVAVFGRRRITHLSLIKDLYYLGEEEKKTYELIETLQKEHFIERKMGTESYLRDVENYEKGLAEIRKKRTEILSKTIKMMKASDALKKLKEEEERVRRMITEAQNSYFKQGKMGKSRYEKTVGDLKAELVEIERLAETLRSGKNA